MKSLISHSLSFRVNEPLQVTLIPEVTFRLHIAFINVVEVRKNSRIKKFIQKDSNLSSINHKQDDPRESYFNIFSSIATQKLASF